MNKADKLDELVGRVEALLVQLPDTLNPEIAALRDRVDDGIFDAWTAISKERTKGQRALSQPAPLIIGTLLGTAILLAYAARLLANRR